MNPVWFLIGLLSVLGSAFAAAPKGTTALDAGLVNPGYYEHPKWFKESFLDIREDVAEASEQKKRLILYFYQDGCPYCAKLLRENFSDRAAVEMAQERFALVAINLWGDSVQTPDGRELPIGGWAKELGVEYTPSLVFFDANGTEVFRTEGYLKSFHIHGAMDYVSTGAYRRQPNFQRYLQERRGALEARGLEVDLMD